MAPDYKESAIAGTTWQRACRVVIENPLGGIPSVLYIEEEVLQVEDKIITRPVANLSASFDPTNQLHLNIYDALNQLYIVLREERDQAIADPPQIPVGPEP